ncbi:MAG: restriction endonuclease [Burkholderiales bacterium]|nr:restriction endonuclease [Burkholderiales bacterium]
MAKRTLFSILSEQPWWVSIVVAAALYAVAYQFLPLYAPFVALPFAGVAVYAAWKQSRGRAPADAVERLAALREMSWDQFALAISTAYRKQGYVVEESKSGAFDFTLRKNGQITLLQCRRWKVNQLGVGPVRELHNAMDKNEAFNCVCITAGDFSPHALEYAAGRPVRLVSGAALLELTRNAARPRRKWKIFPDN